jgi:hypothetical protein
MVKDAIVREVVIWPDDPAWMTKRDLLNGVKTAFARLVAAMNEELDTVDLRLETSDRPSHGVMFRIIVDELPWSAR